MIFLNYQQLSPLFAWHNKMKNITFVFFISLIICCCINLHAAQQPLPKVLVYLQGKYDGMPGDGLGGSGGLLELLRANFPGLNFVETTLENIDKHKNAAALIYSVIITARTDVCVDWDNRLATISTNPGFSKENVFVAALVPGDPNSAVSPPNKYKGFDICSLFYKRGTGWYYESNMPNLNRFGKNVLAEKLGLDYNEIIKQPAKAKSKLTTPPQGELPTQDLPPQAEPEPTTEITCGFFSDFFADSSENLESGILLNKIQFSTALARLILVTANQIAKNISEKTNKTTPLLNFLTDLIRSADDIATFCNDRYKNRDNFVNQAALVCGALVAIKAITKTAKSWKKTNSKKINSENFECKTIELEDADFEDSELKVSKSNKSTEQKQASKSINSLEKYVPYVEGLLSLARFGLKLNKGGNHTNIANTFTALIAVLEFLEFYSEVQF